MKKIALSVTLGLLMLLPLVAQDQEGMKITLEDAIVQALKNNYDIRIATTDPEIAALNLRKSKSIFIPKFTFDFTQSKNMTPTASVIQGGDVVTTKVRQFASGLSEKLPIGGDFTISFDYTRRESDSRFSSFNPSYEAGLTLKLSQPLLKNMGDLATKRMIYMTRNNQEISLSTFRQQLINMIYTVEEAYWNLVYSYRYLEVAKKSLRLSQDLLQQNETKVKVGISAPMDVLSAKAEVANNESALIQAQSQILTRTETLRNILNLPDQKGGLQPVDEPSLNKIGIDFQQLLQAALEKRPDIEKVKLELKNKNIDVRYYRNQMLPDLKLTATYSTAGLSGDQIIFDGDPFRGGQKIGVIEGKASDAVKDAFSDKFNSPSIQLGLSIPLLNTNEKADLTIAKYNLEKSLLTLKKTEATIYSEVKNAIQDVETKMKVLESSRVARDLAEQTLAAEQKKLAVGLTTNYQVLLYQRDFANRSTAELQALIDYNLALSNLQKIVGTTLDKHNVKVADFLK